MTKQLLHLVFGGELVSLQGHEFRDLSKVHVVGIYPNFREAQSAWRSAAQATVDNAHMRYFVVHLHRLLDGEGHEDHDHDHAPVAAMPVQVRKAKTKPKPEAKPKTKPKPAPKTKFLTKSTRPTPAKRRKRR
jgi:hypothetical protein